MRPIRLPEPPPGFNGAPDVLGGAIRRALVVGNGFAGAESQCVGLVRALGLADRHSLQISEIWSYPPLNDTAESAAQVHEALAKRGWKICT